MNLNLVKEGQTFKKTFNFKPQPEQNGVILRVHHTDQNSKKVRFIHCCFSRYGQILALSDNEGTIFAVNLQLGKFWNVQNVVKSSTVIAFSPLQTSDLLVGTNGGLISIIDIEGNCQRSQLRGHSQPVKNLSFTENSLCLSCSTSEAIVWDLIVETKLQVLNLERRDNLKQVIFMPVSANILALFEDDMLYIWNSDTYESKVELEPLIWFKHAVKSISFTVDGKIMILGCHPCYLALFLLTNYKLRKFITLPIQTLKEVVFIPQINDGGANKILAVLSGRGSVHFYNIEENLIVCELTPSYEITKMSHSIKGNYFACILCSGDVEIYDSFHCVSPSNLEKIRARPTGKPQKCTRTKSGAIKKQIGEILAIEKLRTILRECGEYPDLYRSTIWEQLLELPKNRGQYNAIINHRILLTFEDLTEKYPLEDKKNLKNLRRLLDNLVTWSPFFQHVNYLPIFVFPFVRVFQNNPLVCFEAVCTVILNWCQFWFEYFPLPPINILAIVENILIQHDPQLMHHLMKFEISSKLYAWPLLQSCFSEVLTIPAWKAFWDHVLTNEPSFLLCGTVAYNILQRGTLLTLHRVKQFEYFYNTHHPIDVKKLITKSYWILNRTSEHIHPGQYLNKFKKLESGEYPHFFDYPKTVVHFKEEKSRPIKAQLKELKLAEVDLVQKQIEKMKELEDFGRAEEEKRRVSIMQETIKNQLLEEQAELMQYQQKLAKMRENFKNEDNYLMEKLWLNEKPVFSSSSESIPGNSDRQSDTQVDEIKFIQTIVEGMKAIDDLIGKIERELNNETVGSNASETNNKRVLELQVETRNLDDKVKYLMQMLMKMQLSSR